MSRELRVQVERDHAVCPAWHGSARGEEHREPTGDQRVGHQRARRALGHRAPALTQPVGGSRTAHTGDQQRRVADRHVHVALSRHEHLAHARVEVRTRLPATDRLSEREYQPFSAMSVSTAASVRTGTPVPPLPV